MKLNLNTGLSALPKVGGGSGPAPFPNTKSTDFDGVDDYIATATGSSIGIGNIFSISAWVNADALASYDAFCGSATNTSLRGGFGLITVSGNWRFYVGQYNSQYIDSSSSAATGSWVHLLGVYDNSLGSANMEFFVNGASQGTANRTTVLDNNGIFEIGRIYQNAYNLNGKEDEVSLWDIDKRADASDLYNSGTPTNLAAESGLVAWYRMGDSAVFNANSQWEFPEQTKVLAGNWSSHSFEFSTDDYIDIGLSKPAEFTSAELEINGDMSISAWIKMDAYTPHPYPSFVNKRDAGGTNYDFYWEDVSGDKLGFYDGSTAALSNTAVSTGVWHHVAITINSGVTNGSTFYVDGVADGTATFTITADDAPLLIGLKVSHSDYLHGLIDDVAVFDEALTSGNVTSIYASGVPNDVSDLGISGLVGYWRMGEGADWNNTNWQVPDYSKNALFSQQSFELDGVDQSVSVPYAGSNFSKTSAFSISMWVNPHQRVSLKGMMGNTTNATGIRLNTYNSGSPLFGIGFKFHMVGDGTWGGNYFMVDSGGLVWSATTWWHLVITYDGSETGAGLKMYVDGGTPTGSASSDWTHSSDSVSTNDLYLGAIGNPSGFFDGMMDSVSIWNTELTAGNVTSIFGTGVPNDVSGLGISGLVGWWKMGEGSTFSTNWTIPDASTNSNDGTSANVDQVDRKFISPGNEARGESSGMDVTDNINNAPGNENQGLSVGMVSGSVVEDVP